VSQSRLILNVQPIKTSMSLYIIMYRNYRNCNVNLGILSSYVYTLKQNKESFT